VNGLRIAIPNKGRLQEETIDLLRSAGIRIPHNLGRRLVTGSSEGGVRVLLVRAQDIPEFVEVGAADLGITGRDLVLETDRKVEQLLALGYGRCRLVLAAPEGSTVKSLENVPRNASIATAHPRIAEAFFHSRNKEVQIVRVSGATEAMPSIGVADLIVDLVETGTTLRLHNFREVVTIERSEAVLIGPSEPMPHRPVPDLLLGAIRSVLDAIPRRYLMANLPRARIPELERICPGLAAPTVMDLQGAGDLAAVHVVVEANRLNEVIPGLKELGASGILVLPIERLVP